MFQQSDEPALETQTQPLEPTPAPPYPPLAPPPPADDPDVDAFLNLLENLPEPAPPSPELVPFAPAGNFVNYYGLKENPFADSVHPAFFFRTDSHAEAFRSM